MIKTTLRQKICLDRVYFAKLCVISTSLLFLSQICFAVSTSVLPENVNNPSLIFNHIKGIDQRFTEDGKLVRLTDYKSIEFNAKNLSKFNPDAKKLISSLNKFGGFNLGDAFNLGVLEVQTNAQINFVAPVYAKGITSNWTMALAVPLVKYENKIQLSQSFSNIDYYKNQFSGLSNELDAALNTDIRESTQQALVAKGYKRLESKDEKFIGDLQIISRYKLFDDTDNVLTYQTQINLPTGPKYDPNDLLALNSFHEFSTEHTLVYSYLISPHWQILPYLSGKYVFETHQEMRVPKNSEDQFPDQDTIENITKTTGFSNEIGLQNNLSINDQYQINIDYKLGQKQKDQYSGEKQNRYELLEPDTETQWQKASIEFLYSTIKAYFRNDAKIPYLISLKFFDTLSGKNIERRSGQELAVNLFF